MFMNTDGERNPVAIVNQATELLRSIAPDIGQFDATSPEAGNHDRCSALGIALGGLELVMQAYRIRLGIDDPREVKSQNSRKLKL
jgi:hypothetical protein